jgi:2-amino-4-hydroxy-6-hydroxymethyldihydropteridine diphosphokinase
MHMNSAYLLLGGNIGDRLQHLRLATAAIEKYAGTVLTASSIYETEAWGIRDQAAFYNCVVEISTSLSAIELLNEILRIEKTLGRVRDENSHWQARIIDIDILFFNRDIIQSPDLIVPHPHLQDRRFALMPLVEIAPELEHPLLQKTVEALLNECKDHLQVNRLTHAL